MLKRAAIPAILFLFLTACTLGGTQQGAQSGATPISSAQGAPAASTPANKRLEIETFGLSTPSPTPPPTGATAPPVTGGGPDCTGQQYEQWTAGSSICSCPGYIIDCQAHTCTPDPGYSPSGQNPGWITQQIQDSFQRECSDGLAACDGDVATRWSDGTIGFRSCAYGKPVIYLYPQQNTVVSVKLTIPGTVTESDPIYPTTSGWQNILATPGGRFFYQGKPYRELYYESQVTKNVVPQTGLVIKSTDLKSVLSDETAKLGLVPTEQQEFLAYWLPKLQQLHSPYMFFSILTPAQKDVVDHVDITPKPDVSIAFLVYFRPLAAPIQVTPLFIPIAPTRHGFTAVEWGGTIDKSQSTGDLPLNIFQF